MTQKPSVSSADPTKRTYTQPFVRDPDSVPKRWYFEERDQEMLVATHTHEGMLTSCQFEALFFAPALPTVNPRSAKRSAETRLQYLFHKSYLERLPVQSLGQGRSTIAHILGPAGSILSRLDWGLTAAW